MSTSRQLAAIMFTDIVGYSALMSEDESRAFKVLTSNRSIQKPLINRFGGVFLKEIGDGVLARFSSVSDAVFCAAAIQMACENVPDLQLRIGIHQGEVIFENNDVFGDGVNIASRIEALAAPGGICISATVYQNVVNRKEFKASFIKEAQLKNISYPIKAYQVEVPDRDYLSSLVESNGQSGNNKKKWLVVLAGFITLVLSVWFVWQRPDISLNGNAEVHAETSASNNEELMIPTGLGVAVLKFDNLSNDPEQDYFVDGLAEDIITELSQTDLFVLASETSFRFDPDSISLSEISRELKVRYLMTGSVRRQENSIRVTARLVDGTTEGQLWGSTYDRNLTTANIFSLQDDITRRVVSIISDSYGVIARMNMESIERKHPDELNAYECVLRASKFGHSHTQEDHLIARDCLEKIIEHDSTYVDALAKLAYLYREEYLHNYNQKPHALERALKLARKAVELDPMNKAAFHALAVAYFGLKDVEEFFIAAERAIELSPNNSSNIGGLGIQIALAGEWERGISLLEKAMLLNPYSSFLKNWLHFARASDYCLKGRYTDALTEANQVRFRDVPASDIMVIAILVLVGQEEKAQSKVKEVLSRNPDFIQNARQELGKYYLVNPELIDLFMSKLNSAVTSES